MVSKSISVFILVLCVANYLSFGASIDESSPVFVPKDHPIHQLVGGLLCENTQTNNLLSQWDHGLYNAQIHGYQVNLTGRKLSAHQQEEYLADAAQKLALNHQHGYFLFGICSRQGAWYASLPISGQLEVTKLGVQLPKVDLDKYCTSVKVAFAPENRLEVADIEISTSYFIPLQPNQKGVLSVVCVKKTIANLGGQLLFIAPWPKSYKPTLPIGYMTDKSFVDNINLLRNHYRIASLKENQELMAISQKLWQHGSLAHNRDEIKKFRQELEKSKRIFLLNENRATAYDLKDALTLMMISPTHRQALLNPKAKLIGIYTHVESTKKELNVNLLTGYE